MPAPHALKRTLTLPLLTFFGLGTILGAGIYVLVGEVAGLAGMHAPLAFVVAAVVASFTAFSYAELAARHPTSAAEAVYVQEGFGRPWLSMLAGALVLFAALASAAALANGFAAYLRLFVDVPAWTAVLAVLLALGALAAWGIHESARAAAVATLIEIGGLLLVVAVSGESLLALPQRLPELAPPLRGAAWPGIFLAAFVAFFAFIGFEDMANLAEEVIEPERTMPRAILLALAIATALYLLVAVTAVLALSRAELAGNDAPLALMYAKATGREPFFIGLIALFAVLNGALVLLIRAARVLHGLSARGWLPAGLGRVHPVRRTPMLATAVVTAATLALALALPLASLARATSAAILVVFCLINLALLRIRRRVPAPPGVRGYPAVVPLAGCVLSLLLLAVQLAELAGMN
ncbi:MAG: amino acid transporter [Rhodocyclaceae bacterium]|uniref:APC family permease n=1 Tax=Candidatus Desulfobacillus denitrificans TaxID=2608985 RepID=A0A809R6A9_9PROT|nr:APC family permease [Rhodocyclaceae bacterium]BBO19845.1 APC family permease [Candidatus Desulfobacillus denitrificans]GIK46766.1 MAG: amino acid transporter [Betaproteobacteria bacterium]GJQ56340.1 MAG: amino acid transporter [Rhodocyclaceae bacterium]